MSVALWHERIISHHQLSASSPDTTILIDYMLNRFGNIVKNLDGFPWNMIRNMNSTGLIFSQRHVDLIEKGMTCEHPWLGATKTAYSFGTRRNRWNLLILFTGSNEWMISWTSRTMIIKINSELQSRCYFYRKDLVFSESIGCWCGHESRLLVLQELWLPVSGSFVATELTLRKSFCFPQQEQLMELADF